jgi:transposase
MFTDEARFGRMNRIRPCWAPIDTRPKCRPWERPRRTDRCIRGPTSNMASFQAFLDVLARRFSRQDILLVLDGAPNHRSGDLVVPDNITLLYLPPYSPELNPKENLWDEIREKIFKNYTLKSMDAVRAKLKQAILYIEHNPKLVRSITSFPYIVNSL